MLIPSLLANIRRYGNLGLLLLAYVFGLGCKHEPHYIIRTVSTIDSSMRDIANYRVELQPIIASLDSGESLNPKQVGLSATVNYYYHQYELLGSKASIEELLKLIRYRDPVVRGYASWALIDKKYPYLDQVLLQFLQHDQSVPTMSGCIGYSQKLSTMFYTRLKGQLDWENDFDSNRVAYDTVFYREQCHQCARLILDSVSSGELLDDALADNNANIDTYNKVRSIVITSPSKSALIALAAYRRREDIRLIKAGGASAFSAIAIFPDTSFWDILERYQDTARSREYFQAIASFKNMRAKRLLSTLYTRCNPPDYQAFDEALIDHYCPVFQSLVLRMFSKHQIIDLRGTRILIHTAPKEATASFIRGLRATQECNLQEFHGDYGTKDSIIPLMMKCINAQQPDAIMGIRKNALVYWGDAEVYTMLENTSVAQLQLLLPDLLQRLYQAEYPFRMYTVAEKIFACGNESYNRKVVNYLHTKQYTWDSENWADRFRELFEKYHIRY